MNEPHLLNYYARTNTRGARGARVPYSSSARVSYSTRKARHFILSSSATVSSCEEYRRFTASSHLTTMFALVRYLQDNCRAIVPSSHIKNFDPDDISDFNKTTKYWVLWGDDGAYYQGQVLLLSGK